MDRMSRQEVEDAIRILRHELRDPANSHCAECGAESTFANLSLGIFVCELCADIHREMKRRISRVESGDISYADAMRVADIGNARSRRKWLAKYKPGDVAEPTPRDNKDKVQEFIWLKYEGSWRGDPRDYDERNDRYPSFRPPPIVWPREESRRYASRHEQGRKLKKKKKAKSGRESHSEDNEEDTIVVMTLQGPVQIGSDVADQVNQINQIRQVHQMQQVQQMQQAQQLQQMQQMQQTVNPHMMHSMYTSVNPAAAQQQAAMMNMAGLPAPQSLPPGAHAIGVGSTIGSLNPGQGGFAGLGVPGGAVSNASQLHQQAVGQAPAQTGSNTVPEVYNPFDDL